MKVIWKKLLTHLLIFVGVCIVLLFALRIWLGHYTHHNQAIRVPDLSGMSLEEASSLLSMHSLRFEVIDSIHHSQKAPGVVLEQRPAPDAKVKTNRIIYLTINSKEEENQQLPYVKDYSQRQAVATLEAVGFEIDHIDYRPSEYRNLVLDVLYRGQSIEAGAHLPVGSKLVLVVGQGKSSDLILLPDFVGMTLDSAILLAHEHSVNIGKIVYDELSKSLDGHYFIYRQEPAAHSFQQVGGRIDVWMSKDSLTLMQASDTIYESLPDQLPR